MVQLAWLILRRNALRSSAIAAALALIVTIAATFAWISPSLQASELALWRQLDGSTVVGYGPDPSASCMTMYTFVSARVAGEAEESTLWGHPVMVTGPAVALVGLTTKDNSTTFVFDTIAATQMGLADGDTVIAMVKHAEIRGRAEVVSAPVQLVHQQTGTVAIDNQGQAERALADYGLPDASICFGGAGDETVVDVVSRIQDRQAAAGLVSSATFFGAVALSSWLSSLALILLATARRYRSALRLLSAFGAEPRTAAVLVLVEVIVAGGIAVFAGPIAAWWLRDEILRLWTDPSLVLISATGLGAVVVLSILSSSLMLARGVR